MFSSTAWCYGDNDFIIRAFDFIVCSYAVHVTCSTDMDSHVTCSNKKKTRLFMNYMQLQGFPIDSGGPIHLCELRNFKFFNLTGTSLNIVGILNDNAIPQEAEQP